jgi:large subunit ribosomal protein L18
VRKTGTKTIVQFSDPQVIGDATVAAAISTELASLGWNGGVGNLPAAYLTGLLAGRRAKARDVSSAVLDIGLHPPIKGSRVFAALKGAIDAGLEIKHNSDVFPDEDRLTGNHIVASFKHFNETKDSKMFSKLGKKKTTLTTIPKQFKTVKDAIMAITPAKLMKKKKTTKKPAKAAKATPAKKPKKERPAEKPPRQVPRKPKPKKLIARGKGKKRR